jgi:tight adherence protein B
MDPAVVLLILAATTAVLLVWGVSQLFAQKLFPSQQERVQDRLISGAKDPGNSVTADAIQILRKKPQMLQTRQSTRVGEMERRLRLVMPVITLPWFACLCVCAAMIVGMMVIALAGPYLGVVAGVVVGSIPVLIVRAKLEQRERILSEQLVDALDFMARVMRAGHSLATALQMSAEELPKPISDEFRRAYDQHALGIAMEDALMTMATRMDLTDFNFFVTSVIIQRQTGGDLAEILDNISAMIRNRSRLQQQVKALTSEGRATGYVLAALPVFMFVILELINPAYAGQLLFTPMGRMMLGLALGLLLLGLYLIKRIVTIKV